jgi:hypothetical protein
MFPLHRARRAGLTLVVSAGLLWIGGCLGGPASVNVPAISPQEAGQQAVAEYDANGDGVLDLPELRRCPALEQAAKDIDKNGDKKLTADEIADRLEEFRSSGIGIIGLPCRVLLDNKPLEGATVTLRPEKFMGPAIKPASGVSDEMGHVLLKIDGESIPGTQWGYFKVEVSKKDASGSEKLPMRYNSATTLGREVRPGTKEALVLRLTTRS